MRVKFIKGGVFTSIGKVKRDDEVDLPDKEVNLYLQKGWLVPMENITVVTSDQKK